MTLEIWLTLAAIVVLLLISAFFSGSETALTAVSRARMHKLEQDGNARAAHVNHLIDRRERLIGTILLGNNLVNILASALTTRLFMELFGGSGVVWATLVMTAMVVIFAEVLPKTYAIAHADRAALRVAPLFRPLVVLFGPVSGLVEKIVNGLLALLSAGKAEQGEEQLNAEDELRGTIDLHHREGLVVKHDRDMLGGILDLKALDLKDIMVHRTKMQALNIDEPVDRLVEDALKSPYSRLPLWRDQPENIIGVLHVKDLVRAWAERGGNHRGLEGLDIEAMAIRPWFVPETTSVKDQLAAFLRKKRHFALVVDEYGEVQGLVTLEDILEEIVGDILDEHDAANTSIRPQPDGSVNVDGLVPIRDLNRQFDWNLPEEHATTIAGLVIHNAQTIPEPGQRFSYQGFVFEVLRRKRNQITALRITPPDAQRRGKPSPRDRSP